MAGVRPVLLYPAGMEGVFDEFGTSPAHQIFQRWLDEMAAAHLLPELVVPEWIGTPSTSFGSSPAHLLRQWHTKTCSSIQSRVWLRSLIAQCDARSAGLKC